MGAIENGDPAVGGPVHPERFDPERSANTLMDSEHRGRYSWAAQIVAGRSVLDAGCGTGYGLTILADAGATEVTGVDIDPDAVADASRRAEGRAKLIQGDLHALELPDDSFDIAVCFETIEHLVSPEEGLAEMRRVVRPGGAILVSSPNPDVYPSGNEHHLHELRPNELRRLVQRHFPTVRIHLQHAWLASVIEPANGGGPPANGIGVRRTNRPQTSGTTYSIVIGCDAQPPQPSPLITLGDTFEVRWWEGRVSEAERRGALGVDDAESVERAEARARAAEEQAKEAERRAREIESNAAAKLSELELETARRLREGAEREARLRGRLQETSAALVEANQELAQAPVLKHRLAEQYARSTGLEAQLNDVLGSRSWRVTAFLRRWRAALKPKG